MILREDLHAFLRSSREQFKYHVLNIYWRSNVSNKSKMRRKFCVCPTHFFHYSYSFRDKSNGAHAPGLQCCEDISHLIVVLVSTAGVQILFVLNCKDITIPVFQTSYEKCTEK
jgi:ribosomal protein L32E